MGGSPGSDFVSKLTEFKRTAQWSSSVIRAVRILVDLIDE
jgi:hypothetical protein